MRPRSLRPPTWLALACVILAGASLASPADAGPLALADALAHTTTELRAATGEREPFVYRVGLADPQRHEFQLSLRFVDVPGDAIDLQMPKWNPGAYRLTGAHRNVRAAIARPLDRRGRPIAGESLPVHKLDEVTWQVEHGGRPFALDYRVWCGAYSGVGGCYLDDATGFFNAAMLMMAARGHETRPIELEVGNLPDRRAAEIVTGLPPVKGSAPKPGKSARFWAENFDALIDGPVHVGEVEWIEFELAGKPIRAAMTGNSAAWDRDRIRAGLAEITASAAAVFGPLDPAHADEVLPFTDYTFIFQRLPDNRGGLEHRNSTVIGLDPFDLTNERGLERFWSVSAHEFFHLWNVKRIRPAVLGPFDYSREVHTTMLWFAEGFTSYYAWLILARTGLIDERGSLAELSRRIAAFELEPGRKLLSVEQSSWETWAKPDDEQAWFSYYDKGMAIGLILDLHLRACSKGTASTDTVFAELWKRWRETGLGLSPEQLEQVFVEALPAGPCRDETTAIFRDYVHGVVELDYDRYLALAGYRLDRSQKNVGPWIGVSVTAGREGVVIDDVEFDSPADRGGLGTGDRLRSVDGHAITSAETWQAARAALAIGEAHRIGVERQGRSIEREVVPIERGEPVVEVVPIEGVTAEQSLLRREWLGY
ncbi:M61 family metallopeptidase [Nannocystaceae bacterium ST9]